jgi:carbamate kinase
MYAIKWSYTAVHHSAESDCWLITAHHGNGDQVGDAEWEEVKADALDTARAYLDSDRCDAIHVYTKDGRLQANMSNRVSGAAPFGGAK